jgi:hypothetical protein
VGSWDKLVEDLARKPPDSLRDELIRNALLGRYHDFKSTLDMPKVALVSDLERFGYRDLARKAIRGDYDDRPDAEDTAAFGNMLAADPALAQLWEQLQKETTLEGAMNVIKRTPSPGDGGDGER